MAANGARKIEMSDNELSECGGCLIKKCRKKVGENDSALSCVECERWFYIECQNISLKKYKKIRELNYLKEDGDEPDGIEWRCDGCRVVKAELGRLTKRVHAVEQEIEKGKKEKLEWKTELNNELEGIKRDIKQMQKEKKELNDSSKQLLVKDDLEEVKKEVKEMKQGFEQKIKTYANALSASLPNTGEGEIDKTNASNGSVSGIVENLVAERIKEEEEKRARINHLIVFGLIEQEGIDSKEGRERDAGKVVDMLKFLGTNLSDDVVLSTDRLGKKKASGVRPLLVKVKDERTKWYVISKGKLLKQGSDWEGVFIAPDLTQNERKNELKLRSDLKKCREESSKNGDGRMWTIKKGRIVEKLAASLRQSN